MRIAITVKTGKGENVTEKEIVKTVDTVLENGSALDKKYGGFSYERCRVYPDGAGLVLKDNYFIIT
jgi:hypothetical protein